VEHLPQCKDLEAASPSSSGLQTDSICLPAQSILSCVFDMLTCTLVREHSECGRLKHGLVKNGKISRLIVRLILIALLCLECEQFFLECLLESRWASVSGSS
jgi:hypothetical protein